MVNWDSYLDKICDKYAEWWTYYTLTDVEGRHQVKGQPPLLDFIMVETVQPAEEEPSPKQEETERLVVLDGLRKYAKDHVLLVGRPGSGKSTALARLLLEEAEKCKTADEQQKVPVLVELRYYQTSILDLIRSFFKQHGLLLDIAEIEKLLFDKRLLLLVDGLNELPSESARQDLICFRRENAIAPMIFTTRDLNVGGDLGIAKKLEMQPLTESQMRTFVKNYLKEQGDRLLQQLSDRLRGFGQTPLLLMMLCLVFKATGNVPSNLGLVFREFTKYYDRQRLQDVSVTDELRRWWQPLLEHLAWKMTQGREPTELQVAIPKQEAEEIFTEFLRQEGFEQPRDRAMTWLEYSLKHHLIQLGAEDKIEFRHQLIQEYYTAESLRKQLAQLSDDKLKREYLNYLKWTEPLALMLELVEQEEQVLRVVKLALEVDFRLAARLAGSVKLDFQEKTVALVAEIEIAQEVKFELLGITRSSNAIASLIQVLNYSDEDFSMRRNAAEALGNIGKEAAVPDLICALEDEDSSVRRSAAKALGKIGTKAAVTAVINLIYISHDESYDQYINLQYINSAETLGKLGNEGKFTDLIHALDHEDYIIRMSAAEALGNNGNEAAVPALVKVLRDPDPGVRSRAAKALGNISSEAAVPALVEALRDPDSGVRSRAADALGNIGNESATTNLIQVLDDEDSWVCLNAAEALGKIARPELLPQLFELIQTNGKSYLLNTISAIQERCKYYNYTLTLLGTLPTPLPNIPQSQSISASVMHILHLSDLHFGTRNNAKNWCSQLADDLIQELDRPHLNALILSGDIANRSTPEEYAAAKEFLDKLCTEFELNQEQVIIVPGNHDLNWEISDESYKPEKRKNYKGSMSETDIIIKSDDYIEVLDPEQYKRRFEHFSNFYQAIKGKAYPTDCDRQYTLDRINNLLILGLNSAWQLDHHYKSRASINQAALSNALDEIRRNLEYQNCQKIAVWHHPLESSFEDRIKENNFLERLAVNGFHIFLHGHVHQAQKGFYEYDAERGLYRICAGTFGAATRELPTATAWQYHLLKFEGDKLTVRSRKRQSETGAWEADTCWRQGKGKPALDRYEIQLPAKPESL